MRNRLLTLAAAMLLIATDVSGSAADQVGTAVFPADRQEIQDLISAYSRAYDSKDIDAFLDLFTADATLEIYASGAKSPLASLSGKDALRSVTAQRFTLLEAKGIQTRHFQTNTLLTALADGVVNGTTMLNLVWQAANERPVSATTGIYADVFVKSDGHWKFARRTLLMDQVSPPN